MIKIKRILEKRNQIIPLFLLLIINIIFFFYLFFPENKLIITPEYGGGDINIFHYPIKYHFQESLKNKTFLLWSKSIGGGYPIYAQGETGFFDPINFLTLFLFSFVTAINLQIFFYFYILLVGTYFLARNLKLNIITSIFTSITFSYSFFNIANIIHLSHLASFCYIPFVINYLFKILEAKKIKILDYFLLIFILILQTISGHPQYLFYSWLFLTIIIFFYFFKKNKDDKFLKNKIIFLIIFFLFYLGLTSFYLLPVIEYYFNSNRQIITNISKFYTSMIFSDLLTFFYPFLKYDMFLNIKSSGKLLPPWDGNLFLGFGSTILLLITFISKDLRKYYLYLFKKKFVFFILLIVSLLIALGDASPLYFLITSFPFSLFRVPSRILFIFLLFLTLCLGFVFNYIWKTKNNLRLFLITIFLLNFLSSFFLMYKFNLFTSEKEFFKENKIINYLKERLDNQKFISLYFYEEYLPYLLYKKGFNKSFFDKLKIQKYSLPLNLGLIYKLNSFNLPTPAHNLKRHFYFYNILYDDDQIEDSFEKRYNNKEFFLDSQKINLLRISSIKYILSPYKLITDNPRLIKLNDCFKLNKEHNIYLYKVEDVYNKIYLTNKLKYVTTLKEFENNLKNLNKGEVIIEDEDIFLKMNAKKKYFNNHISYDDYATVKKIFLKNNEDTFLVINENYYPNWQAYLNNKKIKIYKTNLNFMGIFVPKGINNKVILKFEPKFLLIGLIISTLSFFFLIFFIIFLMKFPHLPLISYNHS